MQIQISTTTCKWILALSFIISSCKKETKPIGANDKIIAPQENIPVVNNTPGHVQQTKTFSSAVAISWMDMQYKIFLQPQFQVPGQVVIASRLYAYCGVALYESVVPGMPLYRSLSGQLTAMPAMPGAENGTAYHWAASANAALAYMTKKLLPLTSAENIFIIDSLENVLNIQFQSETDLGTYERSRDFGKTVAQRIFDWSQSDGLVEILTTYPAYIPPVGPGLWVPTPPSFQPMSLLAYYGGLRTMVPGILNQTTLPAPIPYSTGIHSKFYKSMDEVYAASLTLTTVQQAQATYWRGTMGGNISAHWYSILKKVLLMQGNNAMLDLTALAYCKMGIAANVAGIAKFKSMFLYNQLRPVTYIRNELGHSSWLSFLPTNVSPGYPELHSPEHSASAEVMSSLFGTSYHFSTNGTSSLPGYSFNSFNDALTHATQSRFYAGLAMKESIEAGIMIGKKTMAYMNANLNFLN